jgi:hypothetical protein
MAQDTPRLTRYNQPATAAFTDFVWRASEGAPITFLRLQAIIAEAEADGVPGDAVVQWGVIGVYFNWRRPA